ncbi:MAG: hypothetical protein ACRENJ_12390 [Candidatus Eiseniibacteriota bacterium]
MFRRPWNPIVRAFALAATLATGGVAAGAVDKPVAPAMGEFLVPVNEAEVAAGVDPALAARIAPPRGAPARALPPLAVEIRRRLDQERRELADLTARMRASRPGRDRLALEREVERVKMETEMAALRLQLDEARRLGRTETVRALEAAIEGFLDPRPQRATTPPERPAPPPAAARPVPSPTSDR